MAVMLPTTTISVLRRPVDPDMDSGDEDQGPYSEQYLVVAKKVRADISSPGGSWSRQLGGSELKADAMLIADPCDLQDEDVILDERTGLRYSMSWFFNYDAPGHLIKSSQAALTRTALGE